MEMVFTMSYQVKELYGGKLETGTGIDLSVSRYLADEKEMPLLALNMLLVED